MKWTKRLMMAVMVMAMGLTLGLGGVACSGSSKSTNRATTVEEFKKSIPTNDVLRGRAPDKKGPHEKKTEDGKKDGQNTKPAVESTKPEAPADPTVKK